MNLHLRVCHARSTLLAPFIAAFIGWFSIALPAATATRPNIVVIVVDDMGYSDIGCSGGGIQTLNHDNLAQSSHPFHALPNNAQCCAKRAALLHALSPHPASPGHPN